MGPTRSSTAEETADSMRSLPLPLISPSATLASLTRGATPHPNFFRTVPSDRLQIQVGRGTPRERTLASSVLIYMSGWLAGCLCV